ncbi:MAG: hypothetical protein HY865_22210 [Chloroflexi bacterium]|nr:hypothetical protein [Chloroflexota bacterium]
MPKTSTIISFGLFVQVTKQDGNPACSDLQPFSKIADLKTGTYTTSPFISMEPGFWLLNGDYKFLPVNTANVHVGLMSLSMSDGSGNFSFPPVLNVVFSEPHNTNGLVLLFSQISEDWCSHLLVSYYDAADALIASTDYYPASWSLSTEDAIEGFQRIAITFYSTNKPYRYLRLQRIDYGRVIEFTEADVKTATVVEETNLISTELPIGTLELNLQSNNAEFSITNPEGAFAELQVRQPLDVYEIVGTNTLYIGRFYLDEWETKSETEVRFYAVDAIGILDTNTYWGGIWLTPVTAEVLIAEIMGELGMSYELDTVLEDSTVQGWLPICSYRQALLQIAFAIGAKVYCARSGSIVIKKSPLVSEVVTPEVNITSAEKSAKQKLSLKTMVTGVELTTFAYSYGEEYKQLASVILGAGTHYIKFSKPCHDTEVSSGDAVVTGRNANYVEVEVATAGTIVISGYEFQESNSVYSVYNSEIGAEVKTNIVSISNSTLVHPSKGGALVQRLYDFYQQRYVQEVRLYAPSLEIGQSVLVDVPNSKKLKGFAHKATLDLTGGFRVDATMTGVLQ